jgi:hypothetical protein
MMTRDEVKRAIADWWARDNEIEIRYTKESRRIGHEFRFDFHARAYAFRAMHRVYATNIAASRVTLMDDLHRWPSARTALWAIKHSRGYAYGFHDGVNEVIQSLGEVLDTFGATDDLEDLDECAADYTWCSEYWANLIRPVLVKGVLPV